MHPLFEQNPGMAAVLWLGSRGERRTRVPSGSSVMKAAAQPRAGAQKLPCVLHLTCPVTSDLCSPPAPTGGQGPTPEVPWGTGPRILPRTLT